MRRALDLLHIDDDDAEALGLSEENIFFFTEPPPSKKNIEPWRWASARKYLLYRAPPKKMSLAYISPRWASAKKYVIYYHRAPLQPKAHIT